MKSRMIIITLILVSILAISASAGIVKAGAIKPGIAIKYSDKLWSVSRVQMVKSGTETLVKLELEEFLTGSRSSITLKSTDTVEQVQVTSQNCLFVSIEDDAVKFFNTETSEEVSVDKKVLGTTRMQYLQDGMNVDIESIEKQIVKITLPNVTLTVTSTAGAAGQTTKSAVLENGMSIQVPAGIEAGAKVVVNANANQYIELAK